MTPASHAPSRAALGAPALRPLELAAGVPLGAADGPSLPNAGGVRADTALADELLGALTRPPCFVAFSGGRDSSGILALATHVARRDGLPDPIPVTWRFPRFPAADESGWQELVVRHLGLREWELIELDEQADVLGGVSCDLLDEHGLLWPPNAHLYAPALELARGGSLVTGIDGDELLGGWRWARAQAVLSGAVRPQRRDVLRVGLAITPARLRRRLGAAGFAASVARSFPWLRPAAVEQIVELLSRSASAEPRRWGQRVGWYARRRYLALAVESLDLLGRASDVVVSHPLLAPRFLAAIASEGRAAALGRVELMRLLFGAVLPDAALARRTKADLTQVIWGRRARAFARSWTGAGVDAALVDSARLREAWSRPDPPYAASTLLRAAWLASRDA